MLINDLEYFEKSANYCNTTSGLDHPDSSPHGSKDWYAYPIRDFDYQFNSWGFRGPDYSQYIGKSVNICLGDSFTVNVGGPIEHSWCSQLAKRFDIPTLNLGMDGAGNDAIRLVYDRACKIFDVQNTFVMYSYLHRRLTNNRLIQTFKPDEINFAYFLDQRIQNTYECMLPWWCFSKSEKVWLTEKQHLYLLWTKEYFGDRKDILDKDREKYTVELEYNILKGDDWPSYNEFLEGKEHKDMYTRQFGGFLNNQNFYLNRDCYHMNHEANKIYADYLYNQWKQRNES
jgi:hypothetical protein